jgi:hypothetical protein
VTLSQRHSPNPDALQKIEKLSDQLDAAQDASEATTKEVQHARRTAQTMKRAVLMHRPPGGPKRKHKHIKDPPTVFRKSKAAVELGRKGGAARAKTLTKEQRSALATKAAKARWKNH